MNFNELSILKYSKGSYNKEEDRVIIERPLIININGEDKFNITCLPGNENELAVGLCFCNSLINSYKDIISINRGKLEENRIEIETHIKKETTKYKQNRDTNSFKVSSNELFILLNDFSMRQKSFNKTGGTHSASIYDYNKKSISFLEDIGRHNALDKCIGRVLIDNNEELASIAILSSRINGEIVKKACCIGLSAVVGLSAPTTLAVKIAKENSIALVGFLRENRFNMYNWVD